MKKLWSFWNAATLKTMAKTQKLWVQETSQLNNTRTQFKQSEQPADEDLQTTWQVVNISHRHSRKQIKWQTRIQTIRLLRTSHTQTDFVCLHPCVFSYHPHLNTHSHTAKHSNYLCLTHVCPPSLALISLAHSWSPCCEGMTIVKILVNKSILLHQQPHEAIIMTCMLKKKAVGRIRNRDNVAILRWFNHDNVELILTRWVQT